MRTNHAKSLLRAGAALALGLLLTAGPASAYVVFLKNGSQIITAKKYELRGAQAILTLANGNTVSYKASEIDIVKTDAMNKPGSNSGALVLDDGSKSAEPEAPAEPAAPSFGDLIAKKQLGRAEPVRRTATGGAVPTTAAGYVNMVTLTRVNHPQPEVAGQLMSYLKGQNVEDVRVYAGTTNRRALVEVAVASEASTFKAMKDVANCMIQIGQAQKLEAIELLLLDDDKRPAGQFTLTADLANQLAAGRVEPSTFFVRYVEY